MAVVSILVMATLIAALGAVTGMRALSGALTGNQFDAGEELASSDREAPRPPTTQSNLDIAVATQPDTTTSTSFVLGPLASTTLVVPELRRSPTTVAPVSAPPPPAAPPPTTPPTPPPTTPPTTPTPPSTTTTPPSTTAGVPAQVHSYQLIGGSAQILHDGEIISLTASTPNDGFTVSIHSSGPTTVTVRFDSDAHSSLLSVQLVRGEVVADVVEKPAA